MARTNQRPRDLTPGAGASQDKYKAPMHFERQKNVTYKHFTDLYFKERSSITDAEATQTLTSSGLEGLSLSEKRALTGIQFLLFKTGFKGHKTRDLGHDEDYDQDIYQPILDITLDQLCEASALSQLPDGSYSGRDREDLLDGLEKLEQRRVSFTYKRRTFKGSKTFIKRVQATDRQLIGITKIWTDLTVDQDQALDTKGRKKPTQRLSKLTVECSYLLVDQADKWFVLKRRMLINQLGELWPGRQQPTGLSDLAEYICTINFTPLVMKPENLARIAGLGYLIDNRKVKKATELLEQYLDIIKSLGIITAYKIDGFGNMDIDLNPEECSLLGSAQRRKEQFERRKKSLGDGSKTNK